MTTTLKIGSATDVGRIRKVNQDSNLVEGNLAAVADGVGGHQGGEVASQLTVDTLRKSTIEPTIESLVEAAKEANTAVYDKAMSDPELRGMGTTLCAVSLVGDGDGEELAWVSVGDSRIYLFRDGELTQLTTDHSLVEDLKRDGQLSDEEAAVHPQRNIITRALGMEPDVRVDTGSVIPFTGDRYLICSDGLTNEVDHDAMVAELARQSDPDRAATDLVRQANDNGGRDNITCVIVDVTDDGGRSAAASAALADEPTQAVSRIDLEGDGPTQVAPSPAPPPAPPEGTAPPGSTDYLDEDLRHARTRRITWRVVLFLFALLLVGGVIVGAVGYTARNTYYVGFSGDEVTIFKGKPGGQLWFDPTVEQGTSIKRADVPAARLDDLKNGSEQSSVAGAREYVRNLQSEIDSIRAVQVPPATTPPTTAPPTSTLPTSIPPSVIPTTTVSIPTPVRPGA